MLKITFFIFIHILWVFYHLTVDAQQVNYVQRGCEGAYGNYTEGSIYEENLNHLFTNLSSQTLSRKFFNSTHGATPNRLYGLYQCREDLSFDVCRACIQAATQRIVQLCPLYGEAIIWYDECMLRYANRSIFSLYEITPAGYIWNLQNISNNAEFARGVSDTMNGLIDQASLRSSSGHFATRVSNITSLDRVYGLAQCTPDIDNLGCNSCLRRASVVMSACCRGSIYAKVFLPSCQLRHDMNEFYNVTRNSPVFPPPSNTRNNESGKGLNPSISGVIAGGALVALLLLIVGLWLYIRARKETYKADEIDDLRNADFVQYDFSVLKAATCDFSNNNKLGEGGFGPVYKGILNNGQEIAIKRLSAKSGQGANEFMTEARLVAKLQHKNLVKLLGFCSSAEEKILVYEFLPNSSLDRSLFDPIKRESLNWETRSKIILGIARGLQYLHEDSRLTIIHRDLKPANILLDKNMNPKIADFGTARLFGAEEKLGNTNRIVGTHGYMAPEYLLTGEYSEKSDVYSFGIIIFEIVSGERSKIIYHTQQIEDMPNRAWRLWVEGKSMEFADPVLQKSMPHNKVMKCIHIGLLCVQGNAEQRPTMATVVLMLSGSLPLPSPTTPIMSLHNFSVPKYEANDKQNIDSDQSTSNYLYSGSVEVDTDIYSR